MALIAALGRRLLYLIRRRKIERELELEMRTHREMMSEPVRFGNTLRLREEARDVWGWNWLDAIVRDLLYAVRSLRRAPGFAAAAVLILTAAIGVNLAFLQIVNSTLLRPLPVRDPSRLIRPDCFDWNA